jgi:magnesium chelatase family protein
VPAVKFKELAGEQGGETSSQLREGVVEAGRVQMERYRGEGVYSNAQMGSRLIRKHCVIDAGSKAMLEATMTRLGLSARAYDRILKVSRTLADLEVKERIEQPHVSEAIQYRTLDRNFWA